MYGSVGKDFAACCTHCWIGIAFRSTYNAVVELVDARHFRTDKDNIPASSGFEYALRNLVQVTQFIEQ